MAMDRKSVSWRWNEVRPGERIAPNKIATNADCVVVEIFYHLLATQFIVCSTIIIIIINNINLIFFNNLFSFDVLGAESMGQIGYVLAQALSSAGCTTVPIICQVVVDPQHEAFRDPSKFVGPI